MIKKLLYVFCVLVLFAPGIALSDPGYNGGFLRRTSTLGTTITTTTLDAASSSFTWDNELKSGAWDLMIVYVTIVDASNSVTAIAMSCSASKNGGTTLYPLQDITVSAGVGTSVDASWTKDPSALSTKRWPWRVDIAGFEDVKCTFTDTGGDASDSITVVVDLATAG